MNPEVLLKAKLPPSEVSSAVGRLSLTGTSCPFKPGWAVPELTCEKRTGTNLGWKKQKEGRDTAQSLLTAPTVRPAT